MKASVSTVHCGCQHLYIYSAVSPLKRPEELKRWLDALPEDPGLVPGTHRETHNHL